DDGGHGRSDHRDSGRVLPPARLKAGPAAGARLQIDAETDAAGTLAAAERPAQRERGTLADAPAVADRERPLAAVEAGADRDASARAAAVGGVDGHVEHGRAHRALAVDAAVLPVQASVEVGEAVLERFQAA